MEAQTGQPMSSVCNEQSDDHGTTVILQDSALGVVRALAQMRPAVEGAVETYRRATQLSFMENLLL